jgi:Transcription antiterminator
MMAYCALCSAELGKKAAEQSDLPYCACRLEVIIPVCIIKENKRDMKSKSYRPLLFGYVLIYLIKCLQSALVRAAVYAHGFYSLVFFNGVEREFSFDAILAVY